MNQEKYSEICCVCGRDVKRGGGLFADRVPEFNDYQTKVDMNRKFPHGEWVCVICDNTYSDGVSHDAEGLSKPIDHVLNGRKQIRR